LDLYLGENSHPILINSSFEENNIEIENGKSTLTVQWFLNMHVFFINGSTVPGACVVINNSIGKLVHSLSTDNNGSARHLNCTEYVMSFPPTADRIEKQFHVPLNISATMGGHVGYTTPELVLTENADIRLTIPDSPPTGLMAGPADAMSFLTTDLIMFNASPIFDKDGDILTYTWISSIDGELYSGHNSILYRELSIGEHNISLNVKDRLGGSSSDLIKITVFKPTEKEFSFEKERFDCEAVFGGNGRLDVRSVPIHKNIPENAVSNIIKLKRNGTMVFDCLNIEFSYSDIDPGKYDVGTLELYYRDGRSGKWVQCNDVKKDEQDNLISLLNTYNYSSVQVDDNILTRVTDRKLYAPRVGIPLDTLITYEEVAFCLIGEVMNHPPVAQAGCSKDIVKIGLPVQFSAEGSHDPDGDFLTYWWDLDARDDTNGDGNRLNDHDMEGFTVSHMFRISGAHIVTLCISDGFNRTPSTDSVCTIVTDNHPPVVIVGPDMVVNVGDKVEFNASNSYDLDGDELEFFWNFGDGYNETNVVVYHRFRAPGRFNVNLTVSDGAAETIHMRVVEVEVKENEIEARGAENAGRSRIWENDHLWNAIVILFLIFGLAIFLTRIHGRSRYNKEKVLILFLLMVIALVFTGNYPGPTVGEILREPPVEENDITIRDEKAWSNEIRVLDGNLTVRNGGILRLDNMELRFNCSFPGQYGIIVETGGSLNVVNNSIITATNGDHNYFFIFEKESTGILMGSIIEKCGGIGSGEMGSGGAGSGLRIESDQIIVENCTLRNNINGIICYESSPKITNNLIINSKYGISLYGLNKLCAPIISNNIVLENHLVGISIWGSYSKPTISNNLITHTQWPSNQNCFAIECFGGSRPTFINNIITGNDNAIKCIFSSPTFMDCTITNTTNEDLTLSVQSHPILINTTFNESRCAIRDSTLTIRNYLDMICKDIHNSPIENVNITIIDGYTAKTRTYSTDVNGNIPLVNCTYKVIDENSVQIYNNTIIAEKKGVVNSTSVCLDTERDVLIRLVQCTNEIPAITLFEDAPEYSVWDLDEYFFDIKYDHDELDLSYSDNEHINVIINSDHTVDLYPEKDWYGTEEIRFTAVNPDGNSIHTSGVVMVKRVDDLPVILPAADIYARENETIIIEMNATDVDGDDLIFSIPANFANNPRISSHQNDTNFTIRWDTDFHDAGHHTINVSVKDKNSTTYTPVNITIEDVNRPPPAIISCSEVCIQGDTVVILSYEQHNMALSFDPDGDDLSYIWDFGDNTMVENGSVVTHKFEMAGNFTIDLTVSDGHTANTTLFRIHVKPLNITCTRDRSLAAFNLNCTEDVTHVEYYLGTTHLATDRAPPYEFDLPTTGYPNGRYMLVAKVYYPDEDGEEEVRYVVREFEIENRKEEAVLPSSKNVILPVAAVTSISIMALIFIRVKDFGMQYFEEFGRRGEMDEPLKKRKAHKKKGVKYFALIMASTIGTRFNKLEKEKDEKIEEKVIEGRIFTSKIATTMLFSTLLIGLAFSIVEASSEKNIFAFQFSHFVKVLPITLLTAGVVVVFSDFIEILGARLNFIRSNFQLWRLGNILMFFSAIVLMAPFGLPARVSNVKSKPVSKKSEAMMAMAKAMSIALFLIPFYFILTYASDGSYLHLAGKMGASVVLMLYLYTMFPLWPFEGYDVYKWNKGAWVGCFGIGFGMFLLHSFEMLPAGFLSLFGCIGLILFELSMFWLYRQYRERKEEERIEEMTAREKRRKVRVGRKIVKIRAVKPGGNGHKEMNQL